MNQLQADIAKTSFVTFLIGESNYRHQNCFLFLAAMQLKAGFTLMRIRCVSPYPICMTRDYDRLSMEPAHTSLEWLWSELQRSPVPLWLCFRFKFSQKFRPNSDLNRWTGTHRNPLLCPSAPHSVNPASRICCSHWQKVEVVVNTKNFYIYCLRGNI